MEQKNTSLIELTTPEQVKEALARSGYFISYGLNTQGRKNRQNQRPKHCV